MLGHSSPKYHVAKDMTIKSVNRPGAQDGAQGVRQLSLMCDG